MNTPEVSSIYGPVHSWRLGQSLGVDLMVHVSACTFDCCYCQLGRIQLKTAARQEFVSTQRVRADLLASAWRSADVITFSGNGEPTLAVNLGECLRLAADITGKPTIVLTNATLLHDAGVREELAQATRVFVKLDAVTDRTLRIMNHPVEGITAEGILDGILAFKRGYSGRLAVQTMLMPANLPELDGLCHALSRIAPEEVQLNTPLRPVPRAWYPGARGNHQGTVPVEEAVVRVISREEAAAAEQTIREKTGLNVVSVYKPQHAGPPGVPGG